LGEFVQKRPIFVPLVAAFPVLSIFSANLALLPLSELWRPLVLAVLASLLIWLLLTGLWRSIERGAASAAVVVAMLYLYHWVITSVPRLYEQFPALIWGFATLVLALAAGWKLRATYALNVIGLLLIAFSCGTIITKYANLALHRPRAAVAIPGHAFSGRAPDIVYIILDGYARADDLKRVMGLDNRPFVKSLADRGFYVADASHSNYVQTELSLASSLNMELIPQLLPNVKTDDYDRSYLDALVDDNAISRFLKARGYTTTVIATGFPAFHFKTADLKLDDTEDSALLDSTVLQLTPLGSVDFTSRSFFDVRRRALWAAGQNLIAMAQPIPKPRFIFAHILAPHPPFVFDAGLNALPHHGPFGYEDGSDFMALGKTREEYRDGYREQIQGLNKLVTPAIDALLKANPQPIIVIQGDHGSKLWLDQNSLAKTDVNEAFPNLCAIYVPPGLRSAIYPELYSGITPVNEFRIILSALFGADLPLLPDKSWYSGFDHPYAFTEVTDRLRTGPITGGVDLENRAVAARAPVAKRSAYGP
jgi:hypothetical protein